MRRLLVERARARRASKRGGGQVMVTYDEALLHSPGAGPSVDLIALDAALTNLASLDPEQARIVELRFFGGLSVEETAEAMSICPPRQAALGNRERPSAPRARGARPGDRRDLSIPLSGGDQRPLSRALEEAPNRRAAFLDDPAAATTRAPECVGARCSRRPRGGLHRGTGADLERHGAVPLRRAALVGSSGNTDRTRARRRLQCSSIWRSVVGRPVALKSLSPRSPANALRERRVALARPRR